VWDWLNQQRITSNKLGKPVTTLSFSDSGEYFVTAGVQHLKYWYFDKDGKVIKTLTANKESIMESKSADLEKVKVRSFVGVQCRNGHVYALSCNGILYIFDAQRRMLKWMGIKVDKAYSCAMTNDFLMCGCSDGTVRVFEPGTLNHILTLPKPPPLGTANIESGLKKIRIPATKESKFADAVAVAIDDERKRVVVVYSDRMMFMWDIKNLEKISVYRTFLYHSGPIHDLQCLPVQKAGDGITQFATCSADKTIRFWHYIDMTVSKQQEALKQLPRNAYCKDMSKMIYVAPGSFEQFKAPHVPTGEEEVNQVQPVNPDAHLSCFKCSPDGAHVASGDLIGNIRIHDLKTLEEIKTIQAHDQDVTCLEYSPEEGGAKWLASGSRDRLI